MKQVNPFEAIDSILEGAGKRISGKTLLDFAKANNFRVTSGFSKGGHNSGSMHYQGNATDPGAIDIDHRGVDYNTLLALANKAGYSVHDERSRPAGQAVWSGPHFHISKKRSGAQPVYQDMASSTPAPVKPFDLGRPLGVPLRTNYGVLELAPENKRDLAKEFNTIKAPAPVNVEVKKTSPDSDTFAGIDKILADVEARPNAPKQPEPLKRVGLQEGIGNLARAGWDMAKAIPGQIGEAVQTEAKNGNALETAGAVIGGALSSPTDLINLATQAPAAIGNAYEGKQVYKPLLKEVYGVRDIPGIKEVVQRHPLADFIGQALIPAEGLALGLAKKARAAKFATNVEDLAAGPSGFVNRAGQEIVDNATPPPYGFVRKGGQEINPRPTADELKLIDTSAKPGQAIANPQELTEAFAKRQMDMAGPSEIIDPRTQLPEELGPLKTETSEGGIQIATRAGKREIPDLFDSTGKSFNVMDDVNLLDNTGKPRLSTNDMAAPQLEIPGRPTPGAVEDLMLPSKAKEIMPEAKAVDDLAAVKQADEAPQNIYKMPEGGEVYTHGRDLTEINQQLEGVKEQVAKIADIERHLQDNHPDKVPAIKNILDAGKNSEEVKFSYIAREEPGAPARIRDNFIPTHFTFETIKPSTERTYLRKLHGSDEAVISHLKQEIVRRGGQVDVSTLQTKSGKTRGAAAQVNSLIKQLDDQTGGAYLKSPRVHGLNVGETTRAKAGDRGIRLDSIIDSSLTGRKVSPDVLQGLNYKNQIAPTLQKLQELANAEPSPLFKRAIRQIQSGNVTKQTVKELKSVLNNKELAKKFCNIFGINH